MNGVNNRERRHQRLIAWQAWHTAALARTEDMPSLESLTASQGPEVSTRQTPAEQLAIARTWAAATHTRIEGDA